MGRQLNRYAIGAPLIMLTSLALFFIAGLNPKKSHSAPAKLADVSVPNSISLRMTPSDMEPYSITVKTGLTTTRAADNSDIPPETPAVLLGAKMGYISGNFTIYERPTVNTNCTGPRCVIRFDGGGKLPD